MLSKALRKQLIEQKMWERALERKKDSNSSQTWRRTRDMAKLAITDLSLLVSTLPEDKRSELFTAELSEKLFKALLKTEDAAIVADIIHEGLLVFEYGYSRLEGKKALREPAIRILREADAICSAMAEKVSARDTIRSLAEDNLLMLHGRKRSRSRQETLKKQSLKS